MPSPRDQGRRPDQAAPAEPPAEPSAGLALEEEPVSLADLRRYDAPVFLLFWALAGVVFLQFFTRYVLNDSLGWTEEIARYLLIAVTFVGAIIGVRKREHVAVELIYRWLPARAGNNVRLVIDGLSSVFFFFLAVICARLALKTRQEMVSIDVPKSVVYWLVCASFVAMGCFALSWFWRRLTGRVGTAESSPAAID
ncbi:TRAP-type C4-dicarboxylate transport system, small permease component [Tistlia consotensis]|uniref:TRAP transporter small permease protein n=1 Tax=Tistlia consotensis USBA 355 TaxID=560819 RepID=A0A1Y6CYS5_9PROT|nr:TRAP transporter small permease [Tistlia consotensis]SMF83576.1 TRAP-type C4-dicarboxylate transport system, small permease component [Tistlia consotensis USBA 355]SNS33465.1 TRAP-type C4-dicarboxylate transport system, small permease component [Tistlia consotensis]